MPDDFEAELEKLAVRHARALAQDVTALILGRLGIASASSPTRVRAARKPADRVAADRVAVVSGSKKRQRLSRLDRDQVIERVASAIAGSDGLSSGEIEALTKLPRGQVVGALRTLKESGRIFMAGEKRLARYGPTRAVAERASQAGRSRGR
jgi:hypothetical protein